MKSDFHIGCEDPHPRGTYWSLCGVLIFKDGLKYAGFAFEWAYNAGWVDLLPPNSRWCPCCSVLSVYSESP